MRVDLIILFASCALAASSSNASNVRRNPISSATVQSVAESQQGLPVNRLLRDHEAIVDEERWPNLQNLIPSKAMIRSKLPSENDLKLFLAKGDGTPATDLEAREFSELVKALTKKKPDMSNIADLSGKRGDRDVTMTLYRLKESGKLDEKVAVKLMKNQFSYLQHQADAKGKSVFDIVLKTNDPKDPISMFNGEVEVLENYLRWRNRHYPNPEPTSFVADELVLSLADYVGRPRFVSMISTHHLSPEAQLLEKRLYKLFLREYEHEMILEAEQHGVKNVEWYKEAVGEPDGTVAVQRLLPFGEIEKMGVELFNSKELLNLMERFSLKSPGSQLIPSVTTKVKALKMAFSDYIVAVLISKAVKDKNVAIQSVAKELEIEYFKQSDVIPGQFEHWALGQAETNRFKKWASVQAGTHNGDLDPQFIERYREFKREK